MNLPPELSRALTAAEQSIDRRGELPAAGRLQLHTVMDELLVAIHPNAGHYTRAKLGLACAASTVSVTDGLPDVRTRLTGVLQDAELTLQGEYSPDALEMENEALHSESVELMRGEAPSVPAIYSSFACHAALNIVLYDSDFETLGTDERTSAPDEWDASFYASLAHCGGAVWETRGNDRIRSDFWRWYLREAIPFAWDVSAPFSSRPSFEAEGGAGVGDRPR